MFLKYVWKCVIDWLLAASLVLMFLLLIFGVEYLLAGLCMAVHLAAGCWLLTADCAGWLMLQVRATLAVGSAVR